MVEHTSETLPTRSLVDLVGEPRATIVRSLKHDGERSAPQLASELGISDVAVRRHLEVLERDGLITARTVKQARGRPVARYRLTDRAERLFPSRTAELVDHLLDFLTEERGRSGLHAFLRWRQAREARAYGERVDGDGVEERLYQLSEALRENGYAASVTANDDGYQLTQTHCAIYEVAREHPEVCAHEAAMFRRVLGDGVQVARRETLANGGRACVCTVTLAPDREQLPLVQDPT